MKLTLSYLAFAPILAIQSLASPPKEENDSASPAPPCFKLRRRRSSPHRARKEAPFQPPGFRRWIFPFGKPSFLESNVKYFRRIRSSMGLGEAAMKLILPMAKARTGISNFSIRPFVSLKQTKSWPNFSDPTGYRQPIQGQRLAG